MSTVKITGILIKDPNDQGYTGFFREFPEVIAEGDTKEATKNNLIDNLNYILEYKRREDIKQIPSSEYSIESFELELQ
jgi:predicted RNase H-like HicB family nuclease